MSSQQKMLGLELMGFNDCTYYGSADYHEHKSNYLRKAVNITFPSSCLISGVAGAMILWSKDNRVKYPLKFIGLICLFQSVNIFALNSFDANFCIKYANYLMQNLLITRDSWLSQKVLGGWHLSSINVYTIAALQGITYQILYNCSLYCEMLLNVCLNLDVLATMLQPFNRVHYLGRILILMRLGFCVIGFYAIHCLLTVLNYAKTNTF